MNIPGFYNFRSGGQEDPMVSMLMAAIPVRPLDLKGGEVNPMPSSAEDLENLVLVYHLFLKERDPFCVIVPSRR